jgi:hypothetical protein
MYYNSYEQFFRLTVELNDRLIIRSLPLRRLSVELSYAVCRCFSL